jgi:OOP family OmpA-OmpF porin
MPAQAIELPAGAVPGFEKSSTAYASSYKFNDILEAYGLKLAADAVSGVPTSYAKVSNGAVVFNNNSIAYTPLQYHSIFTAYGLELSPQAVSELGVSSYAKAKDGKIVFGKDSIAYGGTELTEILKAYNLPVVAAVAPVRTIGDEDGDGVPDDKDACPGTPRGVVVDERGCWAAEDKLLFAFDSSVIKKDYYPVLDETKLIFDAYPAMTVQIDGHTDSVGTDAYNQKLSERRANAVMKYLVNEVGIASERLTAVGHGEMKPAYPNDTAENRAKNRRVEFTPSM